MKTSLSLAIILISALFLAPHARADCCPFFGGAGYITCNDGTSSGGGCCGVGPCNIFCCNCDGGCRESHTKDQCYSACDSQHGVCFSGCDLSCSLVNDCDICYHACDVARDQCNQGCDQTWGAAATAATRARMPRTLKPGVSGLVRFSSVDKNRDGYITRDEVQAWVKANPMFANCTTDAAFSRADKNHDGRLTLDEVDTDAATLLRSTPPKPNPRSTAGPANLYILTLSRTLQH